MAGKAKPIPDGYHTVTPYLVVHNANDAIAFYQKAFGAEEMFRMPGPGGKVMHAELRIGSSVIMLSDETPQCAAMQLASPHTAKVATGSLLIYTENVDAAFERATRAGAEAMFPPTEMFWGDRFSKVRDPFGHQWAIATHVRDVTPEEMAKAAAEFKPG
ncbi:MAG: VOC family protein [Phycisphaerae bacterium]